MRRAGLLALLLALAPASAWAQTGARLVPACGGVAYGPGDFTALTITPDGRLCLGSAPPNAAADAGIAPTSTTASSLVAKAGPGNLYGYNATAGSTAGFVAVLNAAAAPAAAAAIAPLECSAVPANGTFRVRQDIPDRYGTGIVLLFTSSCSTFTAVAPAVLTAVVQ